MRLRMVLVAPRIPGNVGNIARTCLALGGEMSLVGPLGFQLIDRKLKRTSVGYWPEEKPDVYIDFEDFWKRFPRDAQTQFFFATKNGESVYSENKYGNDVVLLFGNEEEGIPESFWNFESLPPIVSCRIPTQSVRCLNLSVAAAVLGFEVSRQWGRGLVTNEGSENYSVERGRITA